MLVIALCWSLYLTAAKNCEACSAMSHTLCRCFSLAMMCFHSKSNSGLANSVMGGPTRMTYDPMNVLFAGYSAASQALAVPLIPVHLQGLPVPATYIFPDNDPGNAGLCRFEASLAARSQSPLSKLLGRTQQSMGIMVILRVLFTMLWAAPQRCWSLPVHWTRLCLSRMIF